MIFDQIGCLNGITLLRDVPLSQYTRFGIGGPADFYIETADPVSFAKALAIVRESGIESVVIGGGTNLIVADEGFRGVCLKLISDRIRADGLRVDVECGATLQALVDFTVSRGLAGLETMTGIQDRWARRFTGTRARTDIRFRNASGWCVFSMARRFGNLTMPSASFTTGRVFSKQQAMGHSFGATLEMEVGDAAVLRETADRILTTRNRKYPPTMKCAGSIFKNFLLSQLPSEVVAELPGTVVIEGKVPSAWFLEQVGAKGMKRGGIEVADYHANLIYNAGGGTARDLVAIVDELKRRVRERWGIALEEEVQYVGFTELARHA